MPGVPAARDASHMIRGERFSRVGLRTWMSVARRAKCLAAGHTPCVLRRSRSVQVEQHGDVAPRGGVKRTHTSVICSLHTMPPRLKCSVQRRITTVGSGSAPWIRGRSARATQARDPDWNLPIRVARRRLETLGRSPRVILDDVGARTLYRFRRPRRGPSAARAREPL